MSTTKKIKGIILAGGSEQEFHHLRIVFQNS